MYLQNKASINITSYSCVTNTDAIENMYSGISFIQTSKILAPLLSGQQNEAKTY